MKKIVFNLLLLVSTYTLLTGCKKFGTEYDTYFYTDKENNEGPLLLYVDEKKVGELPNFKATIFPGNDTILSKGLHLTLKSGKYKIEAKDYNGNLKYEGELKFRSNSLSGKTQRGSQATASSGKVIVTKLTY